MTCLSADFVLKDLWRKFWNARNNSGFPYFVFFCWRLTFASTGTFQFVSCTGSTYRDTFCINLDKKHNTRSWKTCLVKSLCCGYCVTTDLLVCKMWHKRKNRLPHFVIIVFDSMGGKSEIPVYHGRRFSCGLLSRFCESRWVPAHQSCLYICFHWHFKRWRLFLFLLNRMPVHGRILPRLLLSAYSWVCAH